MFFAGTVNDKCTSLIKEWPTVLVLLSFRMNMRCEVSGVSVWLFMNSNILLIAMCLCSLQHASSTNAIKFMTRPTRRKRKRQAQNRVKFTSKHISWIAWQVMMKVSKNSHSETWVSSVLWHRYL